MEFKIIAPGSNEIQLINRLPSTFKGKKLPGANSIAAKAHFGDLSGRCQSILDAVAMPNGGEGCYLLVKRGCYGMRGPGGPAGLQNRFATVMRPWRFDSPAFR